MSELQQESLMITSWQAGWLSKWIVSLSDPGLLLLIQFLIYSFPSSHWKYQCFNFCNIKYSSDSTALSWSCFCNNETCISFNDAVKQIWMLLLINFFSLNTDAGFQIDWDWIARRWISLLDSKKSEASSIRRSSVHDKNQPFTVRHLTSLPNTVFWATILSPLPAKK